MTKSKIFVPRFINTVLLGQDIARKLEAATRAGFDEVEIWTQDIDDRSTHEMRKLLAKKNLGLTDLQVIFDFDGSGDASRVQKHQEADRLLTLAAGVGAKTLLVPANTALNADQ